MISQLEKLLGTPRDGALLRYSLGLEYAKAGNHARAIEYLREAVARDPLYSAAWKALGKSASELQRNEEALDGVSAGNRSAQEERRPSGRKRNDGVRPAPGEGAREIGA